MAASIDPVPVTPSTFVQAELERITQVFRTLRFRCMPADDGAIRFAEESAPPVMHLAAPGGIERLAAAHWAAFQGLRFVLEQAVFDGHGMNSLWVQHFGQLPLLVVIFLDSLTSQPL
jgi:hypothetical protein